MKKKCEYKIEFVKSKLNSQHEKLDNKIIN